MHLSRERFSLYLVVLAIFSVLAQYAAVQVDNLVSGNIGYWGLADEALQEVGNARYIKDVVYFFMAVLSPILVLASRNVAIIRIFLFYFVCEMLLTCLGLIGHIINPIPSLIFAGFRWMMLLHVSVGLACLMMANGYWVNEKSRHIDKVVALGVLISVAFVLLQALVYGQGILSGSLRLSGLFPNAGAMAYALTGAVFYFFLRTADKKLSIFVIFFCLVGVNLTGSRGPTLIIAIIFLLTFILSTKGNKQNTKMTKGLLITMLVSLILIVPFLIDAISSSSERDNMILAQAETGGRIANSLVFFNSFTEVSPLFVLFGKGLGYGTNSASIFSLDLIGRDSWVMSIDSTHVTFIAQFGMLGYLVASFALLIGVLFVYRLSSNFQDRIRWIVLCISILIMSFMQNIFENHWLLVLSALGLSSFISEIIQRKNARILRSRVAP